ncbi:hypothetical protein [Peribacillus frigoritolerans]|uniref:hypothetical protein n=1 Tax=Peribacillus frigoritolerans TaxID=450367 RepID=UPI0020C177F4|nr:hypothetical protein [Peribacillus frigoritolerans]
MSLSTVYKEIATVTLTGIGAITGLDGSVSQAFLICHQIFWHGNRKRNRHLDCTQANNRDLDWRRYTSVD